VKWKKEAMRAERGAPRVELSATPLVQAERLTEL
jgi:hypothetical protein